MALLQNPAWCPDFPAGYLWQNSCYCTSDVKIKYPQQCHVECLQFNIESDRDFKPNDGGCQCPEFLAGPRCDRNLCHYAPSPYYADEHVQLYCLDNYYNATSGKPIIDNCTLIPNLNNRRRRDFPACPCLNKGYRLDASKTKSDSSCQCAKGYTGDLCQVEPIFNRPSPVPTIGVISFLTAVFFVIGLALWYRKRQSKKLYSKMYQLDPIDNTNLANKQVIIFARPVQPQPAGTSTGAGTPIGAAPPGAMNNRNRRSTLSHLFAGRHNAKNSLFKKKQQKGPAVGPTLYEGADEQGSSQQANAPGYEDQQFGLAPQYQSSGVGM